MAAFASLREIRELHARLLKPLLADEATRKAVLAEAKALAKVQVKAREAGQEGLAAPQVVARLKAAGSPPKAPVEPPKAYGEAGAVTVRRKGRKLVIEMADSLSRSEAEAALAAALADHLKDG